MKKISQCYPKVAGFNLTYPYCIPEKTMKDINKEVGFRIRKIREEKGLTQVQLSKLAGLHRAYIGHIEPDIYLT